LNRQHADVSFVEGIGSIGTDPVWYLVALYSLCFDHSDQRAL